MSLYYKTLSTAFHALERPKLNRAIFGVIWKNLGTHIGAATALFERERKAANLIAKYENFLELARQNLAKAVNATDDKTSLSFVAKAKEDIKKAHSLVLELEAITREIFGEEHAWLE